MCKESHVRETLWLVDCVSAEKWILLGKWIFGGNSNYRSSVRKIVYIVHKFAWFESCFSSWSNKWNYYYSELIKLVIKKTVNPFASWRFCRKTRFEAIRVVFWSLSCYKELKRTTNRFTGRTLRGLLIQMQNISLRSSGMCRKQNFETSRFLSSRLFLLFLPHFFFLLLGIL